VEIVPTLLVVLITEPVEVVVAGVIGPPHLALKPPIRLSSSIKKHFPAPSGSLAMSLQLRSRNAVTESRCQGHLAMKFDRIVIAFVVRDSLAHPLSIPSIYIATALLGALRHCWAAPGLSRFAANGDPIAVPALQEVCAKKFIVVKAHTEEI
jgi:hypothetical protein